MQKRIIVGFIMLLMSIQYAEAISYSIYHHIPGDKGIIPLEAMFLVEEGKDHATAERFYRTMLYKLAANNPHFYLLDSVRTNKQFYIHVLQDHVEKLQGKIDAHQTGLRSWSLFKGLFALGVGSFYGWWSYRTYLKPSSESLQFGSHHREAQKWDDERIGFMIASGLSMLGCTAFGAMFLRKVFRYRERLFERLERDKSLLAALEKA